MTLRTAVSCLLIVPVCLLASCANHTPQLEDAGWDAFVESLSDRRQSTVPRERADIPFLRRALEHRLATVRYNAAQDLKEMGISAKIAAPSLVACLDYKKAGAVCLRALRALGSPNRRSAKALVKALKSPTKLTVFRSHDLLTTVVKKRADKKRVIQMLTPLLAHEQRHTSLAAAQILLSYKSRRRKAQVLAILKDSLSWSKGREQERSLYFLSELGQETEVAEFRKREAAAREAAIQAAKRRKQAQQEALAKQKAEEEKLQEEALAEEEAERELLALAIRTEKEKKRRAAEAAKKSKLREKLKTTKRKSEKITVKSRSAAGRSSSLQQIHIAAETALREVSRQRIERSNPQQVESWRKQLSSIRERLESGDAAEQQTAVQTLAKMADYIDEPVAALISALSNKNPIVRKEAARSLGNIRSESAIESLAPLLEDPETATTVGVALQKIGTPQALSTVAPFIVRGDLKILRSDSVSVRGRRPIDAKSAKEVCHRVLAEEGLSSRELELSVPECVQAAGAE